MVTTIYLQVYKSVMSCSNSVLHFWCVKHSGFNSLCIQCIEQDFWKIFTNLLVFLNVCNCEQNVNESCINCICVCVGKEGEKKAKLTSQQVTVRRIIGWAFSTGYVFLFGYCK